MGAVPSPTSGDGPCPCSTSLSHGVTRLLHRAANTIAWQKRQKKNPPGVGRTGVVARSDTLESISISSRVVVRSNRVVARSDKLVVVASINSLVVARSEKQVFGDSRGDIWSLHVSVIGVTSVLRPIVTPAPSSQLPTIISPFLSPVSQPDSTAVLLYHKVQVATECGCVVGTG